MLVELETLEINFAFKVEANGATFYYKGKNEFGRDMYSESYAGEVKMAPLSWEYVTKVSTNW